MIIFLGKKTEDLEKVESSFRCVASCRGDTGLVRFPAGSPQLCLTVSFPIHWGWRGLTRSYDERGWTQAALRPPDSWLPLLSSAP